jgi:ribosomal protein S15P/S13E
MVAHYLFSQDEGMMIATFEKFDKELIRKEIVNHLTKNPKDVLEHCKDYPKDNINRFLGYNILSFYQVNPKNNKPSKVYTKGNKEYFLSLKD